MQKLDYGTAPAPRKSRTWLKLSIGLLILLVLGAIVAVAAIILLIWFAIWLMMKIAPML